MTAITSDGGVAEFIEKVNKFICGNADYTPTDILFSLMNGANKEYAERTKPQAFKKDGESFINVKSTEGLNAH